MRKCNNILCALLLSLLLASFAASEEIYDQNPLPIGFTAEELTRLHEIGMYHTATAPPTGRIRNCAEWERSEGVIIRWPLGISVAIIKEMSEDIMVTTIVGSESQRTSAISSYTSAGVNMAHTQFIIAPTNTYWTRDYGPWFIFSDQQIGIVDHIYNRPRPLDDSIPKVIGTAWGIPVYGMALTHTGGNHMSDGLGMSMSSRLVWDENTGKTHAQIDSIMYAYLGNDYTVLEYVESGGIHHIDCWAKFLSPNTILVKNVPSSDPSYALLNQRAAYLATLTSAWGTPYRVLRVYCPSGTAYTNSIILNDKVLVPIFSSSWDDDAIQVYQDAMPGYEVLGFTGSWLDDDAIHCRAMGVPDREMLWLDHDPLADTDNTTDDRLVSVHIEECSGQPLIGDSLKIYYSVNEGAYVSAALIYTGSPFTYAGYIPAVGPGSEVSYFVKTADASGRVETHPFIGEPGAHHYRITAPNQAPALDEIGPQVVDEDENLNFTVSATDPDGTNSSLTAENMPLHATFDDNGDGTGIFDFNPDKTQSGIYSVRFIAFDGSLADTMLVEITVNDVNLPPSIVAPDTLLCRTDSWFAYYPVVVDPDDTTHAISYTGYPMWLSELADSLVGTAPSQREIDDFRVIVTDGATFDSADVVVVVYQCGDADGSAGDPAVDIDDVVYLINYIFAGGTPPDPIEAADVDCSGGSVPVDIDDVVYLITFIFSSGPAPCSDCP
jgi:agmatine/peptidylarginine deiminase